MEKIPIVGFLFVSVMGVITAIALLAKGLTYSASSSIRPSKKKTKDDDMIDQGIREAQEISSKILEEAGDNFEVLVTIATIILVLYKRKS